MSVFLSRRVLSLLGSIVFCVGLQVSSFARGAEDDNPTVDRLLGVGGRKLHEDTVGTLILEGKTYSWATYSAWGRELFANGTVQTPPIGPSPSPAISRFPSFTCSKCHNTAREDPVLSVQDPERRFAWIEKAGLGLTMTQGTTLWGVVNREAFYNDHYKKYMGLKIPDEAHPDPGNTKCAPSDSGCREWHPDSLRDAIQVCGFYCSEGESFLEKWEEVALLAYFWDRELRLADVDLPDDVRAMIRKILTNPSNYPSDVVERFRMLLKSSFLLKSHASAREAPSIVQKSRFAAINFIGYRAGGMLEGDPAVGRRLHDLSCAQCHFEGSKLSDDWGADLGYDVPHFHRITAKGKHGTRRRPYMPEFTLERLSDKQLADILAYLQSLE